MAGLTGDHFFDYLCILELRTAMNVNAIIDIAAGTGADVVRGDADGGVV